MKMPDLMYWETATPLRRDRLNLLMRTDLFNPFRLVGGTSLSLQLNHRMSDDIDLFTDAWLEIPCSEISSFRVMLITFV